MAPSPLLALVVAALVLAPAAGCLESAQAPPPSAPSPAAPATPPPAAPATDSAPPMAGGAAPGSVDWSFTDTDGIERSRDASLGKPVVLFFFATWCGRCRAGSPGLRDLQAETGDGVTFLSVDLDASESRDAILAWKARWPHPWPHGTGTRSMLQEFKIRETSEIVVLGKDGAEIDRASYDPRGQWLETIRAAIGKAA